MPPFEAHEHVVYEGRKHWLPLFIGMAVIVTLALLPAFIATGFISAGSFVIDSRGLLGFASLYCSWLLLLWVGGFRLWTDYILDIWIVTDHKLIDIEQRGLFNRHISTLHLEKVQDVTVEVNGILATTMDFGDLIVQSAGTEPEFAIRGIYHPYRMKEALLGACSHLTNGSQAQPEQQKPQAQPLPSSGTTSTLA
jgi:hypothetical protein